MTIEFKCLHCGMELAFIDDQVGQRIDCDGCGKPLTVPAPFAGKVSRRGLNAPLKTCLDSYNAKLGIMEFSCPSCGNEVQSLKECAGDTTTCKECDSLLEIPRLPKGDDRERLANQSARVSVPRFAMAQPESGEAGPNFTGRDTSDNPYQQSLRMESQDDADSSLPCAGFGLRRAAYLIDVIPITLLMATVFYLFFGFDETLHQYFNRAPGDIEARFDYLAQRNQIRSSSFVAYILYCAILEGSALQGTIGKRLLGLRVTDSQGRYLTVGRSFARNSSKIVSYIPCALGILWALWSERNRAWHDMIARTLVVKSTGE